ACLCGSAFLFSGALLFGGVAAELDGVAYDAVWDSVLLLLLALVERFERRDGCRVAQRAQRFDGCAANVNRGVFERGDEMRRGRAVVDERERACGCGAFGGSLCVAQVARGLVEVAVLDEGCARARATFRVSTGERREEFGGDHLPRHRVGRADDR